MRGGKRKGAGRPAIPRKQIRVHEDTLETLEKLEGKTWDDKIQRLIEKVINYERENR